MLGRSQCNNPCQKNRIFRVLLYVLSQLTVLLSGSMLNGKEYSKHFLANIRVDIGWVHLAEHSRELLEDCSCVEQRYGPERKQGQSGALKRVVGGWLLCGAKVGSWAKAGPKRKRAPWANCMVQAVLWRVGGDLYDLNISRKVHLESWVLKLDQSKLIVSWKLFWILLYTCS